MSYSEIIVWTISVKMMDNVKEYLVDFLAAVKMVCTIPIYY